jgi:hypothetical protein
VGLRDYALFNVIARNARLHAQRTAIVNAYAGPR